jgi:hypothetical protein
VYNWFHDQYFNPCQAEDSLRGKPVVLQHIIRRLCFIFVGRDNSATIMIRHGLDRPGIECHQGQDFSHPFRQALGPTHPPAQWALYLFSGPGHGFDHPPPSSVEVKVRVDMYLYSLSGLS